MHRPLPLRGGRQLRLARAGTRSVWKAAPSTGMPRGNPLAGPEIAQPREWRVFLRPSPALGPLCALIPPPKGPHFPEPPAPWELGVGGRLRRADGAPSLGNQRHQEMADPEPGTPRVAMPRWKSKAWTGRIGTVASDGTRAEPCTLRRRSPERLQHVSRVQRGRHTSA